jgi:hypothetical protein
MHQRTNCIGHCYCCCCKGNSSHPKAVIYETTVDPEMFVSSDQLSRPRGVCTVESFVALVMGLEWCASKMYILLFPPLSSMSVFLGEFVKHFNFHIFCLESEIESLVLREEQRLLDQSVIAFSDICLPPSRGCLWLRPKVVLNII